MVKKADKINNVSVNPIPPVVSLHRYFIWANKMRTDFDHLLKANNTTKHEHELYMSYWYAGLYIVIEGWKDLNMSDSIINKLLRNTNNVELLRRYRNGVFHFQKTYFDKRFVGVWEQNRKFIDWVRELNRQFGRYFLEWHREYDRHNLLKQMLENIESLEAIWITIKNNKEYDLDGTS